MPPQPRQMPTPTAGIRPNYLQRVRISRRSHAGRNDAGESFRESHTWFQVELNYLHLTPALRAWMYERLTSMIGDSVCGLRSSHDGRNCANRNNNPLQHDHNL